MTINSDRDYTHIGKVINDYRTKNGISHQKFADLCGVSPSTLQRVKMGETALNIDTAIRIADILGISLDELAGRGEHRALSEADRLTIATLESRMSEQTRTIESQQHTIELLEKDIEGKSLLIDSHAKTIYEQRRSIRRNDIFRNYLLAAFVLAVLVLWFVQI